LPAAGLTPDTLNLKPDTIAKIAVYAIVLEWWWLFIDLPHSSHYDGIYFQNNPVRLTGLASPGWEFVGWSGDILSDSTSITLDMAQDYSLIAWFEPTGSNTDPIVFNEINYNSSVEFNPEDWVELYNAGTSTVDMSGWIFKDGDNAHEFFVLYYRQHANIMFF